MKKIFMILILLIIIFILGCAPVQTPEQKPVTILPEIQEEVKEPVVKEPVKEAEEAAEKEIAEEKKEISSDVRELLSKAEQKVQSISYKYKGPETADFFYIFYVKDERIRIILDPTVKDIRLDDGAYESIYLNKKTDFAGGYCNDKRCKAKGKKATLVFNEVYINTPFDWLDQIGNAEKVGEELLGKRSAWKLKTDNVGIVWVDSFFGVPLQVEFNDNLYRFMQMTFNDVKDSDVITS